MKWGLIARADHRGLAYQSQIKHTISGELTTPLGVTPVDASITLPDIVTLSVVHQLSPSWELLADVAWTNWSKFDRLEVVSRPTGTVISSSPQNWHDTWRGALGVNYRYGTRLKLRGGALHGRALQWCGGAARLAAALRV